jgi:hypothetical protein
MSAITIATAIIGVYIVLALIASNITESISAILDKRGSALFEGVQSLVGDVTKLGTVVAADDKQAAQTLAKTLYQNPLISSLAGAPNGTDKFFKRSPQPSYIPARTFTLALVNEIRQLPTTGPDGAPISLPVPGLASTPDVLLKDLITRIGGLPDSHLKQLLATALQNADQNYESFLKSIDVMFEACMQRVAGWYKRWSQVIIAVFALILVVLLNVDTVSLVQQLMKNATELQTLSAGAQKLTPNEGFDDLVKALSTVPLGWTFPDSITPGWVLSKFFGLIISWFAVMLGAPFWFDVLKRLVPVRMTGDVPSPKNGGSSKKSHDAQEATV